MINFMLPSSRSKVGSNHFHLFTQKVIGMNFDGFSPANFLKQTRKAKATFLAIHGALALNQGGVDVNKFMFFFFRIA